MIQLICSCGGCTNVVRTQRGVFYSKCSVCRKNKCDKHPLPKPINYG